ncbi:MAG: HAD family hydrolase [Corynebacterium sp.]|nr:HAD family hydrolase [Corynebacterium sp.]
MQAPKLIASDIDGTFLNPELRVDSRNRAAIVNAVQSGVHFALCTGRPHRWLTPVLEQLPVRPLCITSNGAVVYDAAADKVLHASELMPVAMAEVVEITTSIMSRHGGVYFAVERAGCSALDPLETLFVVDEDFALHTEFDGFGIHPRADVIGVPAVKLMIRSIHMDSAQMFALLNQHIDPAVAHVTYSMPDGLLEIAAPGITKEVGVKFLAEHFGIPQRDVIAFGDMPNDIEMLRWAGHGVAMGNAHPAAKDAADEVTLTNADAGVAHVLERWFS